MKGSTVHRPQATDMCPHFQVYAVFPLPDPPPELCVSFHQCHLVYTSICREFCPQRLVKDRAKSTNLHQGINLTEARV